MVTESVQDSGDSEDSLSPSADSEGPRHTCQLGNVRGYEIHVAVDVLEHCDWALGLPRGPQAQPHALSIPCLHWQADAA